MLRFKEIVDLSVPIRSQGTPVFPGYPMPLKSTMTTLADTGWLSFLWSFVEHSGTHVDAPAHVIDGATPVDKVSLDRFVAEGAVIDLTSKDPKSTITPLDIHEGLAKAGLEGKVGPGSILLLHMGWTAKAGEPHWLEYPELSAQAAEAIVKLGVNAVGLDSPSPDYSPLPAHKVLLAKNVAIFENLTNLEKLMGKKFLFVGAPLPLVDGSGSPVRAFALVE